MSTEQQAALGRQNYKEHLKKIAQYDGTAYAAGSFVKSFARINQCIIWAEYQKYTSFYPPKQSFRYRKGTKVVRHSQNLYGIFFELLSLNLSTLDSKFDKHF